MTIALAILCLALVGLLVYRERVGARADEVATRLCAQIQQSAEEERRRHAEELAEERQRHEAERKELYQRIQAPEVAVMEAVRESRGDRRKARPIAADDDAAFLARDKPERDEVASA